MTALVIVTPPASEPLSVAEVMAHCRIDQENLELAPTAPTVALASPASAGNVNTGGHRYRVTFVTADGETEGGIVSSAVTVTNNAVNGQIAITAIPIGGTLVTARKIYRTIAGGSEYLLLATIADNTTTTYTDNIADLSLGAGVPTTNTTTDPELSALISAARTNAEKMTRRALITQTWDLVLDRFPSWAIDVPKPSLLSVTSITYIDENGDTQTLDAADYRVDTKSLPGRITPAFDHTWPSTRDVTNAVTIRFVCGFGAAADVPATIKQWMKLRIKHLWDNRGVMTIGVSSQEFPRDYVDGLLDDYSVVGFEWAI